MEASEPKWINSNYIQHRVNSLRLGSLHMISFVLILKSIFKIQERLNINEGKIFLRIFMFVFSYANSCFYQRSILYAYLFLKDKYILYWRIIKKSGSFLLFLYYRVWIEITFIKGRVYDLLAKCSRLRRVIFWFFLSKLSINGIKKDNKLFPISRKTTLDYSIQVFKIHIFFL